jgi:hypothetical protein
LIGNVLGFLSVSVSLSLCASASLSFCLWIERSIYRVQNKKYFLTGVLGFGV